MFEWFIDFLNWGTIAIDYFKASFWDNQYNQCMYSSHLELSSSDSLKEPSGGLSSSIWQHLCSVSFATRISSEVLLASVLLDVHGSATYKIEIHSEL